MRNCLELIADIVAIHIFKPGELSIEIPFNATQTAIADYDIKLPGSKMISINYLKEIRGLAIDTYYNNIPDGSVEVKRGVSVKESAKRTISGMSYSAKISATTYDDIEIVKGLVSEMSSCAYFDVAIVDTAQNVFLCRGVEPSTQITLSTNLPVSTQHSIEIEVVSVNGIIPIIFS